MTVRSALRALRQAGRLSVQSRADGTYLARIVPAWKARKYGVLSRLYFAGCLEIALNVKVPTDRNRRRAKA